MEEEDKVEGGEPRLALAVALLYVIVLCTTGIPGRHRGEEDG
jgi:hypothetical protein